MFANMMSSTSCAGFKELERNHLTQAAGGDDSPAWVSSMPKDERHLSIECSSMQHAQMHVWRCPQLCQHIHAQWQSAVCERRSKHTAPHLVASISQLCSSCTCHGSISASPFTELTNPQQLHSTTAYERAPASTGRTSDRTVARPLVSVNCASTSSTVCCSAPRVSPAMCFRALPVRVISPLRVAPVDATSKVSSRKT